MKNNKVVDFTQAEQNAKKRDLEIEKAKAGGVTKEQQRKAIDLLHKANPDKEVKIVGKKKVKSRAKFVQLIQENWNYANQNNFFTSSELVFLIKIQGLMQFKSNCLVDDISSRSATPLNQTQIAEKIGMSRAKVTHNINGLVEKGILVKAVGQSGEKINAKSYAIFVNPLFMVSGDRDNLEQTLITLFIQTKKLFKEFPEQLL